MKIEDIIQAIVKENQSCLQLAQLGFDYYVGRLYPCMVTMEEIVDNELKLDMKKYFQVDEKEIYFQCNLN